MCPKDSLRIAGYLIPLSIAIMIVAGYIGFIDHDAWSLEAQVVAHISMMLGAGFLKLSYVMHLNASMHLGINDFAYGFAARGPKTQSLPACCLAS